MTASRLLKIIVDPSHSRCQLPLNIDPYPGPCPHGCRYCYATPPAGPGSTGDEFARLAGLFQEAFEQRLDSPWHDLLRKRSPIRLGFMNDPLPPRERQDRLTLRLIELFNRFDHPYLIITKSTLLAGEPYLEALSPKNATVQISLTTLNQELADLIEPHAPPTQARLEAIRRLRGAGVWTLARIDPVIAEVKRGAQTLPYFSLDLLAEAHKHEACGAIIGLLATPAQPPGSGIAWTDSAGKEGALLQDIQRHCQQIGLPCSFCQLGLTRRQSREVSAFLKKDASCCQLNPLGPQAGIPFADRLAAAPCSWLEAAKLRFFDFLMDKLHE